MLKEDIIKKAEIIKGELISIRRELHTHPEIALKENWTSNYIKEKLQELGLDLRSNVGITGIVATLKGKYPGKTIAIRADMDALKITENTNLEFSSKNKGYMHACGHDAHMTFALGAAMILKDFQEELHGNVKFIFQPAEEVVGGAERMIKDGALENPKVDAIIGGHVWPSIPSGQIGIKYGAMMAAPDTFEIKIIGKGGHGAEPHKCIDPIAVACETYTALQTIVSRKLNPTDDVLITVGKFQAGEAPNIIPDEVSMEGTTRMFDDNIRNNLPDMMENIIKGITSAHGASYKFRYDYRYPAVINNSIMGDFVKASVTEFLGEDSVFLMDKPEMIGEDFSYFQREIPGFFMGIGTLNEKAGINKPLHNACFNIDENILHNTAALYAFTAINYLNNN